ncbi:MAG: hypothetical protein AAF533_00005, partial [Acidobacteriota bacterium]
MAVIRTRRVLLPLLACLAAVALPVRAQDIPTGYQEYVILGQEEQVWTFLNDAAVLEGRAPWDMGMQLIISLTASANQQTIRLDHWEDGFEEDIENPVQPSTLVLGDGNPANGDVRDWSNDPRLTGDEIFSGTSLALISDQDGDMSEPPTLYVPVPRNRDLDGDTVPDIRFDGGDVVFSTGGPISVVHAQFPINTTVIGGSAEVLSKEAVGGALTYTVPMGTDTFDRYGGLNTPGEPFKYVELNLTAYEDGTDVIVDNGVGSVSFRLDRAEHWSSDGFLGLGAGPSINILEGSTVQSSKPLGGLIMTAGERGRSARFFALLPNQLHSTDFLLPVSGDDPGADGSRPANAYVYNPNGFEIMVAATDTMGSGTMTIPARTLVSYGDMAPAGVGRFIPVGSGLRLTSPDRFWGVSAFDHQDNNGDWGHSFIATSFLSTYYAIAWAPGTEDPVGDCCASGLNRSPVFVSALTDGTRVQVDLDGDGMADAVDTDGD